MNLYLTFRICLFSDEGLPVRSGYAYDTAQQSTNIRRRNIQKKKTTEDTENGEEEDSEKRNLLSPHAATEINVNSEPKKLDPVTGEVETLNKNVVDKITITTSNSANETENIEKFKNKTDQITQSRDATKTSEKLNNSSNSHSRVEKAKVKTGTSNVTRYSVFDKGTLEEQLVHIIGKVFMIDVSTDQTKDVVGSHCIILACF